MEFASVDEINPKESGYINKLNQSLYKRPSKKPHMGLIKSNERVGKKYRQFVKSEMNHSEDVVDYILPSMYRKTRNWSDCGTWKVKVY
jgi:hypothetical protein